MAIKLKRPQDSEPEVYGNENFGIPKDYSKKQKFSTVKLGFYILAVAAICVTGYKYYNDAVDRFLPEITYDKTRQPMIYSTEDGFVVQTQSGEKYKVALSPDGKDALSMIYPAAQGKNVFFLAEGNDDNVYDLCVYNVDSDKVSLIDGGVTEFKVNPDGKFATYKKETSLYFSDLKESRIVAEDVSEYFLSDNNQVITFFSSDGFSMYTCGTAKDETPILVDSDIEKVVSAKNDHTNIYYIKESALYHKSYGAENELIAKNVIDAIMVGNTAYYTKEEIYKRPISDFLTDDKYDGDEKLALPEGSDFLKEVDGMSFFDEEAFNEANENYEQKLKRDEIRAGFIETPIKTNGYSLYSYSNSKATIVDTHLMTPYISRNSCKDIIVYKKNDTQSVNKKDISDFAETDEALAFAQELTKETLDADMYLLREGEKPYFAFEFFPTMQIEISLDGKYLYCIESKRGRTEGILTRYTIGTSSLLDRKEICDRVTDFALDGSDSSAVMVFSNNTLRFYYNDSLTYLSDNSCREFFFVDRTLFYYDDYDYDKKAGTLCSIRNGVITEIDTQVYAFNVRKHNAVSYIKNYNAEDGTGTLYVKNGSKITQQGTRVGAIIN